jgi:hypothetical protein
MRPQLIILLLLVFACEEVVVVDLPPAQNLIVIEGSVTDVNQEQALRITQSNGFSDPVSIIPITDADVFVQSFTGETFQYSHSSGGIYLSNEIYSGLSGVRYRVRILLSDGEEIRSEWELMPERVPIDELTAVSFLENDPNNPNQQITIYYPKVRAIDPMESRNYYRWVFFRNNELYSEPESITIQDDRFFNGNLIPNDFQSFGYEIRDEIIVQFQSITKERFEYLKLLKSQITTLGTSSGTTPAKVNGNLSYDSEEVNEQILGYFSTVAISSDTISIE